MLTRRRFVRTSALTIAAARFLRAQATSPFKVSVITDEISDDFNHACSVAANDFGLRFVEIRGLWKKVVIDLDSEEMARARDILAKYKLQVVDIASPLYKVDFPGAPLNAERAKKPPTAEAIAANYKKQDHVLEASIAAAKALGCDHVRCFDFWRLEDPAPFRKQMDEVVQAGALKAKSQGITLVLENEHECNTGTAREAVRTLKAVPAVSLNWDPGNAVMAGEVDAFPTGWQMLPKARIHHCHVKNAAKNDAGKTEWSPVDVGIIDWTAQFKALKAVGYREAVSLETHWRGAGTPEASTRRSWEGMKKCLAAAGTL